MSSVDTQLHAVLLRALNGVKYDVLRTRASELSARYRDAAVADASPGLRDNLDCLAYAVVRMPATYRAIQAALRAADLHVGAAGTHLDLGGGTGAAAWAATSIWPGIKTQIVERQPAAIALGRRLVADTLWSPPPQWSSGDLRDWQPADLRGWSSATPVDLATVAYVLNELTPPTRQHVIAAAAASTDTIVLVEPGTPRGYRHILEARDQLIGLGLTIAAPCPHQLGCPLVDRDWCHFAVRLPRTELHRRLKDGIRNYEDEKFSYLVATRRPARPAPARVLTPPARPKNQVLLTLCTADAQRTQARIPKSSPAYPAARAVVQGASWPAQRS
ncbi:small ribosomal subunit Rsm22 family protein [Kribbella sp. NPDC056951]|uniref:small ribosomal subunit Rsm22 family protein n=1 Tax=Kribbella sp. NPDC056951 TaxID=3345978 RepID=UPI003633C0B5